MKRRSGFTLIELLIVVAIIVLLLSILIPSLEEARESARQARCREQLTGLYKAMLAYSNEHGENGEYFPAVAKVSNKIDTQASLWLMVRYDQATASNFVCPSDRYATDWKGAIDQAKPFPLASDGRMTLSYSYQVPQNEVGSPRHERELDIVHFAIMADRSPYDSPDGGKLLTALTGWSSSPSVNWSAADAAVQARAKVRKVALSERLKVNSSCHRGRGQNVLYRDGHVEWKDTPLAGITDDNIYTRCDTNTTIPVAQRYCVGIAPDLTGGTANNAGPTSNDDSYLRTFSNAP
ncbi:MAG: hypothetical protein BIFFINMI_00771 [Phycisphaerae bacterium]|nr:hypothetical protein [Phycisphaerae bacterium]